MLYDQQTKIVSFNDIYDIFPHYKNDTGIKAVVYVQPNEFRELEAFHLANLPKVPGHFNFGAYFPNESVFVYDNKGKAVNNVGAAFDILWSHKWVNVTATFKIVKVNDKIKGISYPIITGHEIKVYI